MSDQERLIAQIHKLHPALPIASAYMNDDGQYNDVIIVKDTAGDEWVFRFAKFAESAQPLKREISILKSIRPHITLDIPQPVYKNVTSARIGEVYMGYRMISGVPLWREEFQRITGRSALRQMARQLATFLKELHSIPIAEVISAELPVEDEREGWVEMYHSFQAKLYPYMRPDAQNKVTQLFEVYLNNPDRYAFTPVLRHGDFGGGNVIFDPDTQRIAGIIDFGATALGDPAIDFGGLSWFGDDFMQDCCAVYPEIAAAQKRMEFYSGTFALQEALYGIEHDDQEAFEDGIAAYR